jgi:hypothetical protein
VYTRGMTTKKAQDLIPGDHLANTSSRVKAIEVHGHVIIVKFAHFWAADFACNVNQDIALKS